MNKKSRLRLTSWLLAVVMAMSIASPALAADASVVFESMPAAVSESTPDNSVPESIPAQGNDVPVSTGLTEEGQSTSDSSSAPESESTPDSSSAPESKSTPDSSSAPENESTSDSGSASVSDSTPGTESDSESPAFTPLESTEMFTHTEAQPGDTVELYVQLNRDDVAVTYQWQVLDASPGEIESSEALYPYGEGESTDYAFLLDGMTEEELLTINPDAVWPGIEMYYAEKERQARQRTLSSEPIHIENGTPNYVLNPEAQDIEDAEIAWRDIDGATGSTYPHVVTGDEEDLSYRCVITITDEAYLAEAAQAENQSGTAPEATEESVPESAAGAAPDASASDTGAQVQAMAAPVEEAAAGETLISDSMYVDIPATPAKDAPALFSAVTGSAQDVHLSEDNQWLVGLTQHMEYITAQAYQEYGGEAANNPYWTKINGGARADGSKYLPTSLTNDTQMEILSAWYGKTVYVRVQGESGPGKAIEIPAYTGVDYQTGAKTLYKSAVKIFNAWVPDTGMSFYNAFLRTALNDGWTANNAHITVDSASIEAFNRIPTAVLTNAAGDYIYDLVIVGASAYSEPDISGAAAWALADYIGEGYGFLIGHDMMYGYAGVNPNPYYEPDPSTTTTPYYVQNSKEGGHWNLNWLMGVNKLYTEASPYDAASMILNIGDFNDKSTMYGDDSGSSTLRIKKQLEGNPSTSVAARCPTNWPYTQAHDGVDFNVGDTVPGTATHTNQQMAFGTVWIDYASNSITSIGGGKPLETTVDGVYGTNNFYLTTNGNFGMSQIGHKSENINLAKLDECYLLANTVMYLSQRQQCQVCQSEQSGNQDIHVEDREGVHIYRVTMTISNIDEMFDAGQTRFYFSYHPTLVFSGETLTAATSDMPLCLDYIVNANFGPGVQNDANNDGVQDSDVCLIDTELGKQYSDWSFPNLTLRSGRSTFQSMILMYDDRAHIDDHYGAGNPDYDKDDKLMFRDGGDGLSAINAKITINNPHYMMITAKSNAGISVEAMESWLRANVEWRSYDPTAKPAKITVYVDVENNLASKTNAVSQFFRSLLGAAPVIDAPGTVQENGTITFTSNAGYPAQWQMSEDGGKTFVDMPGETQPYLVIRQGRKICKSGCVSARGQWNCHGEKRGIGLFCGNKPGTYHGNYSAGFPIRTVRRAPYY